MRRLGLLAALLVLVFLLGVASRSSAVPALQDAAQAQTLIPGDSRAGAEVFQLQHCIECHTFQGTGGKVGPDLSRHSERDYTPDSLAAVMWNHAPSMWETMGKHNIAIPVLLASEAADLYAFFYSVRYFAKPGDAARGKALFASKHCSACHALRAGEPTVGPAVATWKAVSDPIAWIEAMWNHSAAMLEKMKAKNISWPEMSEQDLSDLLVYLQHLPETRSQNAVFAPADPAEGQPLFQSKGCTNCHTLGTTERGKINLLASSRQWTSMVAFAADMWNHAPQMHARSKAGGPAVPTFTGAEMNHLIGYLFQVRFFEVPGNANHGRRVFETKKCVNCHVQKAVATAPDLSESKGQFSPIFMTVALWRHGPKMLQAAKQQGYPWPQMTGQDMADLIAYLNKK